MPQRKEPTIRRALYPLAALLAGLLTGRAETFVVQPEQSVIVLPGKTNRLVVVELARSAAEELQEHLERITGTRIPIIQDGGPVAGRFPFHVGIPAPGDTKFLAPEEARWVVTPEAAYFYGDTENGLRDGKLGIRASVYGFLEDVLGVRWIEPGELGLVLRKQSPLTLTTGASAWAPKLGIRGVRINMRPIKPSSPEDAMKPLATPEFSLDGAEPQGADDAIVSIKDMEKLMFPEEKKPTLAPWEQEYNQYYDEAWAWRLRMRMGRHMTINYGHAFTKWWKYFGAVYPEYFAMRSNGKREPTDSSGKSKETIKLCPSNPRVADRIIQEWLRDPRRSLGINVCENDNWGFCVCTNCTALDLPSEGDTGMFPFLTDRYVVLWNRVARQAREHDPDAYVVTYAYNQTEHPPRRQMLEPNVLLGVVPITIDIQKLEKLFSGWRAMGMTQAFMRPNWSGYYFGSTLPLGFEKQFFDAFQTAYRHGVIGTDYDSMQHCWATTGFAEYVQARAFAEPERSFAYWEDHYCSAYGAAADAVKRYYRYWREELWEKRLLGSSLVTSDRPWMFKQRLMGALSEYYRAEDFDKTDAILAAPGAVLSDAERARLGRLALANQHARLIFTAAVTPEPEKYKHALALLAFREKHREALKSLLGHAEGQETPAKKTGRPLVDTGTAFAQKFRRYTWPWIATDPAWKFRMDPRDRGEQEQWPSLAADALGSWKDVAVDPGTTPGEGVVRGNPFQGVGWYATRVRIPPDWKGRPVILHFEGIVGACQVYVNGKLALTQPGTASAEKQKTFTARIEPFVDWQQKDQGVFVRIWNDVSATGLQRRVWLLSEEPGAEQAPSANPPAAAGG